MQKVWWKQAAVLLQLIGRRLEGWTKRDHAALPGQAVAFDKVADLATSDNINPCCSSAFGARHDMVKG